MLEQSAGDDRADERDVCLVERECTRLIHRYALLADSGDPGRIDELMELFSDEPTVIKTNREACVGRAEVRDIFAASFASSVQTLHVTTNIVIEAVDESSARGSAIVTVYAGESNADGPAALIGPAMVCTYGDVFVPTDAGWRFDVRDITAVFRSA